MPLFRIPLRLRGGLNAREHYQVRARRVRIERQATALACRESLRRHPLPVAVTITRISPGELDDDNLRGACKGVRDQLADELGLPNDRDPRVVWQYGQRKDGRSVYAVEIRVEQRTAAPCAHREAIWYRLPFASDRGRILPARVLRRCSECASNVDGDGASFSLREAQAKGVIIQALAEDPWQTRAAR